MIYSHIISDAVTITKYKGTEPFRLVPDYVRDTHVNINDANNPYFVNNDLILLSNQNNVQENGLYIFSNGLLKRYYPDFFDKIEKIYAVDPQNSSSYIGFFGPTDPYNQLKHIHPGQGIIIFHKKTAHLPYTWYETNISYNPSISIDQDITFSNATNLDFAGDSKTHIYNVDLNFKDYRPFPVTLKISGASELKKYIVALDLVSCPDPEYVRVLDKVVLEKNSISIGYNNTILINNNTLNSQFTNLQQNGIVWLVNMDYSIDGLYEYDGYGSFAKLANSDYLIRTRKYIIDDSEFFIDSIVNDWYINRTLYIGYPGHYDLYVKITDPVTKSIISEDNFCFEVKNITNLPTPTPTVTPTLPRHMVAFDNGSLLKVDNCESCAKIFVGATASNLNVGDNYYYEFNVFQKGVSHPRDSDSDTGTTFEPYNGYLSTGYTTQKFGTYISTADKVRTIIEVKLINLNTGVSSTSYLTLAVCDESFCDPLPTPTMTPTNNRIMYAPRPTPTPTVTPTRI